LFFSIHAFILQQEKRSQLQQRVKDLEARLKEQTEQLTMMNKQRELKHTLVQKQQEQIQVCYLICLFLEMILLKMPLYIKSTKISNEITCESCITLYDLKFQLGNTVFSY